MVFEIEITTDPERPWVYTSDNWWTQEDIEDLRAIKAAKLEEIVLLTEDPEGHFKDGKNTFYRKARREHLEGDVLNIDKELVRREKQENANTS